ncbi:MAG: hypothetical protein CK426_00705 [Legionella sp.]|nr:MAG: hypothetical protein CK423_01995 [Legionella sp.]PJE00060.1 MAG: hypothetical protein CK426_00705 [Legionella sp.]
MTTYKTVAQWLGIFVFLIGLMVIISWFSPVAFLLAPHFDFMPMSFNTALCFLIAGIGLLAQFQQKKIITSLSGLFIGIISILTLLQYVFHIDLATDNFFFISSLPFHHTLLERMPFITACGLFLIAMLLLQQRTNIQPANYYYHPLLSLLILAIGSVLLILYLSGINKIYSTNQLTPGSALSAAGFILFSLAVCINQWGCNFKKTEHRIIWLSTLLTAILLILVFIIWRQHIHLEQMLAVTEQPKTIPLQLDSSFNVLELIAGGIFSLLIGMMLYHAHQSTAKNSVLAEKKAALSVMERQQQIINQVENYAIFWINLQGQIETWNHGAQKMLGYSLHQILGKSYSLLFIKEEQTDNIPLQILNTAKKENTFEQNVWLQKKDHSCIWTHLVIEMVNSGIDTQKGFAVFIKNKEPMRQLELEHARLLNSINESSDFIGMINKEGKLLYCNQKAKEMLGYPADEKLRSITIADMYPYRLIQTMQDDILPLVLKKGFWSGDSILINHLNGDEIPVLQTITLYRDQQQSSVYLTVVMRDITYKRKIEEALKVSETLFRSTMEYAAIGMALVSLDGQFTKVNKALCEIVGFSEEELLKVTFQHITHVDDLQTDLSNVDKLLSGEINSYQMEKRYIKKDKSIIWILLSASLVRNHQNNPLFFIAQIQDINHQKKIEQELIYRVYHDSLTGLANREYLESVFAHLLQTATRHHTLLALMFIDLDYFKKINDAYGHDMGDLLLIELASCLKSCTRANDILVRLGGDEFVVIANDLSAPEDSLHLAEKINNSLTKPITIKEIQFKITISIGISLYPLDGDHLDLLLKNADEALYQVKECGRNAFKRYKKQSA